MICGRYLSSSLCFRRPRRKAVMVTVISRMRRQLGGWRYGTLSYVRLLSLHATISLSSHSFFALRHARLLLITFIPRQTMISLSFTLTRYRALHVTSSPDTMYLTPHHGFPLSSVLQENPLLPIELIVWHATVTFSWYPMLLVYRTLLASRHDFLLIYQSGF